QPCEGTGKRLKLIDGHLRQGMDPGMEVDVEVLDVTDDEARKLLLSIDPLAQLAGYDTDALAQLQRMVETDDAVLREFSDQIAKEDEQALQAAAGEDEDEGESKADPKSYVEQWLVLVTCKDEPDQLALLERFQAEGLSCKALMS